MTSDLYTDCFDKILYTGRKERADNKHIMLFKICPQSKKYCLELTLPYLSTDELCFDILSPTNPLSFEHSFLFSTK